jgi:hypothetical protein
MTTNARPADDHKDRDPGIQTRVIAWVTMKEHESHRKVGEVCRLTVVGPETGLANRRPCLHLYIGNGHPETADRRRGEAGGDPLRPDEASRCWSGLREGDLIEAVGDLGPRREKARRHEVIVRQRVILRARQGVAA